MHKHARKCWGDEAVSAADDAKDANEAHTKVVGGILKNGKITQLFERCKENNRGAVPKEQADSCSNGSESDLEMEAEERKNDPDTDSPDMDGRLWTAYDDDQRNLLTKTKRK
ncbi:hypothetical protein L210DRAFT_3511570 [Boletus edulis BED1]|uniref:Uncharacterized protein n=1 Tax=Boletus edulis BED1 TaxID=1328754 RepID=A0AAD4BB74_BOLED|nr:hypothetical protein L210DRAFT_3511570 [Boletus edulis BED1]